MKTQALTHDNRYKHVGLRLSVGQINILAELEELTGQTKTDLIREALTSYLYPLYKRLKEERNANVSKME